jgi:large subunit ribosomal protein L6
MPGIGHWPVAIPDKVKLSEQAGTITAEGPKGKLDLTLDSCLSITIEDGQASVSRQNEKDESRKTKAMHGLTRKLVANMIQGVSTGFSRVLEINGVGYRADGSGDIITFSLGFSHQIIFQLPPGVEAKIERQTQITLEAIDKQLLGEVAASIRRLRPPDPYKAKGIKYAEEQIRRKAGKTAGAR